MKSDFCLVRGNTSPDLEVKIDSHLFFSFFSRERGELRSGGGLEAAAVASVFWSQLGIDR